MIYKNLKAVYIEYCRLLLIFNFKYTQIEHLLLALTKDVIANYVHLSIKIDEIININNILSRYSVKINSYCYYGNNIKGPLEDTFEMIINKTRPDSLFQRINTYSRNISL
ncbi:hypothetical protein [Wolbachia endosymbiont of Onchocerca gibsoni]|uniref:hypothetical protein n=1 Tax=Wolbachia endosymbiont of Onchocerca gibsoni TaxID=118986 RepID=UPI0023D7C664|nr:hypothetical protein [Wolbachia endosymbiont of Onchocerca gibsoni]